MIRFENTVYFGTYPQSRVTDPATIAMLNNDVGAWKPISDPNSETNGQLWYRDVTCEDGTSYRGLFFSALRMTKGSDAKDSNQVKSGYLPNIVYWFLYEPIAWRVLAEKNGEALLFAEQILDCRGFCDDTAPRADGIYKNNYAHSELRAWLTSTFYPSAFLAEDDAKVVRVKVDNSAASARSADDTDTQTFPWLGCEDTEDKIFLPSRRDVTTKAYGFETRHVHDPARQKAATDYAHALGAHAEESGLSWWWHRTADVSGDYCVSGSHCGGTATMWFHATILINGGVCPMIRIRTE